MTRVAGQDTSRTYVIVSSSPTWSTRPTNRGFGVLHRHLVSGRAAALSPLSAQTGLALRGLQAAAAILSAWTQLFSPADTRAGSRPLRSPGTPLRRPKTTFPDAGLPLKSRLVWIKSYGEEPPLPSFCMPGKAFYHQFRKGNMWFLPLSVLLLAFNAPRAACGNAQKIIWIVPDTCTCSKCVWLGVNIQTTSARCCQSNKAV